MPARNLNVGTSLPLDVLIKALEDPKGFKEIVSELEQRKSAADKAEKKALSANTKANKSLDELREATSIHEQAVDEFLEMKDREEKRLQEEKQTLEKTRSTLLSKETELNDFETSLLQMKSGLEAGESRLKDKEKALDGKMKALEDVEANLRARSGNLDERERKLNEKVADLNRRLEGFKAA